VPPFDVQFYENHRYLITVEVDEVKAHNKIIPLTKDRVCPFLIEKRCSVYEVRPAICRDFGQISAMPCPYVKPDGTIRNGDEQKAIIDYWDKLAKDLEGDETYEKIKPKG
jgi:Fe-S-cluster containining protein